MLRGLTTITYLADDVDAAVSWYTEVLGIAPYFERALAGKNAYVEFRVGDYAHELGLLDRRYAPGPRAEVPCGGVTYWHVDGVSAALDRLVALGATVQEDRRERGEGFVTASVVDPFGNVLGIMENPHYLEVLARDRADS